MERKENVPWSWQDTVGAIALLAIVAVLFLQLGFLSSARKGEMKDGEDRTQSILEEQILAVQDSERLLAENLVENPRRFPDPLILDSTYRENWAIRDGHLNGMPYEVRSLTARESPKKVVSRYTQRLRSRGFRATGNAGEQQGEVTAFRRNTGETLQVSVTRNKDSDSKSEVSITSLAPTKNRGGYYPNRLPAPLSGEGVLVCQSMEGNLEVTKINWGSRKSTEELRFYLLREMWEKGWERYIGMKDLLPFLDDFHFRDGKGGECSIVLASAPDGLSAVEMVARWPMG